jgi:hypothetical protein
VQAVDAKNRVLQSLRGEIQTILVEDAEKAASLEEVLEVLEHLQLAQATKSSQLETYAQVGHCTCCPSVLSTTGKCCTSRAVHMLLKDVSDGWRPPHK